MIHRDSTPFTESNWSALKEETPSTETPSAKNPEPSYDMSIHSNPDAMAWTKFFMKCKQENDWSIDLIDESLMIGWFANAMMAMHDNIYQNKIVLDKGNEFLVGDITCEKSFVDYNKQLHDLIDNILDRFPSKVGSLQLAADKMRKGSFDLFSTDTEIDTLQLYKLYVARFQIEFIFRDAKGFTGFTDCQSRDARRLHYHFNASLVALNVAKLQDQELQEKEGVQYAFSMTNWARKYHVGIVINRFIAMLGLDQTSIKSHPDYESMLSFGGIMH